MKNRQPCDNCTKGRFPMLVWWLNMIGLLTSAFGAYLLAKGTPLDRTNFPSSEPSATIYPDPAGKRETANKEWQQRLKDSRNGFWVVLLGIGLQIVSQIFQYPF